MKAQIAGLTVAGILTLAGCASNTGTQVAANQNDTLNEPSDRAAYLEDHRPPNPNRPIDNRQLKAVPVVVQKDPALDKAPIDRDDKGLAVNAGVDQQVRAQDPTQTDNAPNAVGGPATSAQIGSATGGDNALSSKVKEAIATARKPAANTDPALTSKATNGENKAPNIDVTAKNGVVTLSGSVASDAERTSMEQAASRVPGVSSVNNYLTVPKAAKVQ
jgi:hypothetical protein